jgi:hypothetical protein
LLQTFLGVWGNFNRLFCFHTQASAVKTVILGATVRFGKVIFPVARRYYKNLQQPPHLQATSKLIKTMKNV